MSRLYLRLAQNILHLIQRSRCIDQEASEVETLDETADKELEALQAEMKASFVRVSELVETFGPFNLGMPHIRSLSRKLSEIRVKGKDGITRGIYLVVTERRVVVVHAFVKKTQRTPAAALSIATKRAKEAGWL